MHPTYELAVFDRSGLLSRNPTVFSREAGGPAPELFVTTAPGDPAPAALSDLAHEDEGDDGEAVLSWTVPAGAFAYDVTITGGAFESVTPVPRYFIPFAGEAGATEQLWLRDILEPGVEYSVSVSAIARGGAASGSASVTFAANQLEAYPGTDHEVAPPDGPGTGIAGGGLQLWAMPVTDKIGPSGALLEDVPEDYADNNPVFDGERVALRGLRNDVLSFVLVLQDDGTPAEGLSVSVSAPGLTSTLERVAFIETGAGLLAEEQPGDDDDAVDDDDSADDDDASGDDDDASDDDDAANGDDGGCACASGGSAGGPAVGWLVLGLACAVSRRPLMIMRPRERGGWRPEVKDRKGSGACPP